MKNPHTKTPRQKASILFMVLTEGRLEHIEKKLDVVIKDGSDKAEIEIFTYLRELEVVVKKVVDEICEHNQREDLLERLTEDSKRKGAKEAVVAQVEAVKRAKDTLEKEWKRLIELA